MRIILWLLAVVAVCALVAAFVLVPVLKALLEGTPPQDTEPPHSPNHFKRRVLSTGDERRTRPAARAVPSACRNCCWCRQERGGLPADVKTHLLFSVRHALYVFS